MVRGIPNVCKIVACCKNIAKDLQFVHTLRPATKGATVLAADTVRQDEMDGGRRKTTWRLQEMAEARGTTPVALVREVLATSSTFEEARKRLGISAQALRMFRRRHGIKVVRMKGQKRCPRCKGTGVVMDKQPVPGHDSEFYMPGGCSHDEGGPSLPRNSAKSGDQ